MWSYARILELVTWLQISTQEQLFSLTLLTFQSSFQGSSKQRLDRFLVYFQRYLLFKPPLPLDVEFDVQVRQ